MLNPTPDLKDVPPVFLEFAASKGHDAKALAASFCLRRSLWKQFHEAVLLALANLQAFGDSMPEG
jgi:hypothetical protein